jgi:hypothetical protein
MDPGLPRRDEGDRSLREVAVPPQIAGTAVGISSGLAAIMEEATAVVISLDHHRGAELHALGAILLRTAARGGTGRPVPGVRCSLIPGRGTVF